MHATPEQARILREAVAAIKAHPEMFEMSIWAGTQFNESNEPCGTVCCLAGQIVRNAVDDASWSNLVRVEETTNATPVRDQATQMLDLYRWQAERLFVSAYWPERFKPDVECVCDECDDECYCSLKNPTPEQLEARVEHWIETGE
jgi:hypothetical protein